MTGANRNWSLMKQGLPEVPTWQEFLSKVGMIARFEITNSKYSRRKYQKALVLE